MDKQNKLRKIADSPLTCYAVPFLGLGGWLLYLILSGSIGSVKGYYLIHYLYTYDHGFVSRGLIGEIISWFHDTVTDDITRTVITIGAVLFMLGAVLCIGKALNKAKSDRDTFVWTLSFIIFLCIIPITFRLYYTDIKLDKFLWALTLFAVFLAGTRFGIYFVPVLCLLATIVNPVFLFCSMILISIILLQKFYDSKFSVKNGIICGISYISMIAMGLYSAISEKWLGFTDVHQFMEYYFSRYEGGLPSSIEKFESEWLFDFFEPLDRIFKLAYEIYFKSWGNGVMVIFSTLLFAIPVYLIISSVWIKAIKNEKNGFQRFIFFLCLISPLVLIPPISISWESAKYFGNNMVVQICLMIYYCVNRNQSLLNSLNSIKDWCREHLLISSMAAIYIGLFIS